eukprot:SAG22_NODE_17846_length_297_cov_1.308081_2_plen_37_part_01
MFAAAVEPGCAGCCRCTAVSKRRATVGARSAQGGLAG